MRLFFLWLCVVFSVHAAEDFEREQILLRIKPIGKVQVEGQSEARKVAEQPKKVDLAPGQATYEHYCITCHRDGLAGAPKFRNESDWKTRLAKQKLDELTATAIKGLNAMPPKGTCSECSEEEIKQAIQYMLPKS